MGKTEISPELAATLARIAADCAGLADDWWVFGSAGMALAGVQGLSPPDVDLIVSERDAAVLVKAWDAKVDPGSASPLFRSRIFAKAAVAPIPIEIMAGFELFEDGAWSPIWPSTRQVIALPAGSVFIPTAAEQAQICRRFGRPKDLARIALLDALQQADR